MEGGREGKGWGERLISWFIFAIVQVASQLEQDELECAADGISNDVAFTEAPRSISKSSLRSKASQISITSAIGSIVSETFTQEVHLHSNNNNHTLPRLLLLLYRYICAWISGWTVTTCFRSTRIHWGWNFSRGKKCTGWLQCYSLTIFIFFSSGQSSWIRWDTKELQQVLHQIQS